jgi:CRP-like cAMP-binding protein
MRRQFPLEQQGWISDVFEKLGESGKASLLAAGVTHEIEEGERLPAVGNSIVRVESGFVKVAVYADDRRLTVGLYGPGDTICSPLFHGWKNNLYFLEAQEDSEIVIIPQTAVLTAAAENPDFGADVMRALSQDSWRLMSTIHMLTFFNLPQRVAQVILNLGATFGMPHEKGWLRLGLRFTQEELAELAGARRETLSTVLQQFREDEILDLRYARIDIKDVDGLRKAAGSEPLPFLTRNRLRR